MEATKRKTRAKKPAKKTTAKKGVKKVVVYKARGQYRIVESDAQNIMPSTPETRPEDEILNPNRRARLLDLTRNLVRNSSLFNTILGQMTTNVVSTVGGKVVLSIPNEQTNKDLRRNFFSYTRNVDFYTGDTLNHLLKRVLREYVIGGDCVLIFDDGLVEDSGKILFFESNEIVDVPMNIVQEHYGEGAWSSQGKVYSKNGRHIGTIVSKSQCGMAGEAVDPSKCYFLKKDPNASPVDNYWFHFSSNWREGRGVSQAASAIATIHQLEDLVQSELLASRRNSQIFCWLTQSRDAEEVIPSPFDGTEDVDEMSNEDIERIVKEQAEEEKVISFNRAKENAIVYEALPDGISAQQLQMQHPNQNIQTMVDWLANRCAATLGISKVFATGNPQDSNWRSNQLFSFPAILEMQKDLEQVLDWVFKCFVMWAVKKSMVKSYVADDFMDYVSWEWKGIDDLSPVTHQQGIKLALENNTTTYKELLGNNWKDKLSQVAYEHKWMSENGILHPSEKLISGGQSAQSEQQVEETTTVEEEVTK